MQYYIRMNQRRREDTKSTPLCAGVQSRKKHYSFKAEDTVLPTIISIIITTLPKLISTSANCLKRRNTQKNLTTRCVSSYTKNPKKHNFKKPKKFTKTQEENTTPKEKEKPTWDINKQKLHTQNNKTFKLSKNKTDKIWKNEHRNTVSSPSYLINTPLERSPCRLDKYSGKKAVKPKHRAKKDKTKTQKPLDQTKTTTTMKCQHFTPRSATKQKLNSYWKMKVHSDWKIKVTFHWKMKLITDWLKIYNSIRFYKNNKQDGGRTAPARKPERIYAIYKPQNLRHNARYRTAKNVNTR